MTGNISESRFFMWRSVVAMVHADGVVTPHELSFINDYINDLSFSAAQLAVIGEDLRTPQHVHTMFSKIAEVKDRKDFFALARALSWCDGDYDAQEKFIIENLEQSDLMAENKKLLNDSRAVVNEIELNQNQWRFKTERSKKLFGFLEKSNLKTA